MIDESRALLKEEDNPKLLFRAFSDSRFDLRKKPQQEPVVVKNPLYGVNFKRTKSPPRIQNTNSPPPLKTDTWLRPKSHDTLKKLLMEISTLALNLPNSVHPIMNKIAELQDLYRPPKDINITHDNCFDHSLSREPNITMEGRINFADKIKIESKYDFRIILKNNSRIFIQRKRILDFPLELQDEKDPTRYIIFTNRYIAEMYYVDPSGDIYKIDTVNTAEIHRIDELPDHVKKY